MRDPEFKQVFLSQVGNIHGKTVLDLGCGTGTLTRLVAEQVGRSGVVYAIDIDDEMLERARTRPEDGSAHCTFQRGNATSIPLPDQSVDRVVSSLLFHHLDQEQKLAALREGFRVLRDKGTLHIVDWGMPASTRHRLAFFLVQLLDGFETTTDNVKGRMPQFIEDAGFQDVVIRPCINTLLGSLQCFHAKR